MKKINLLLMAVIIIASCTNKTGGKKEMGIDTAPAKAKVDTSKGPLVGGDRDEHGCIASAGYSWSALRNNCIRLFEEGTRLEPAAAVKNKTISAFVVFDKTKPDAELFVPGQNVTLLMAPLKDNKDVWANGDWRLEKSKTLVLKLAGIIQYVE